MSWVDWTMLSVSIVLGCGFTVLAFVAAVQAGDE